MGRLTTHVLDTTRGKPGDGIPVALYRISNEQRSLINQVLTNSDGRCDEALLEGDEFQQGVYELVFSVGDYFNALDGGTDKKSEPRFLDDVVIRFGVAAADEHYHVPLLITPYSYSTYRGS
ncbi:hydroxyisourate hydrolase [Granulosicoccus antarcticus]|uniref:5-hydroxyisourate hydrolase n=1 Tax=Granulosicoccus antarcticus IMCC3135 TaxID=1192854 RepID=A0A2Z2NUK7_9GAMM|nr:hydroxyisourate hydrolase [Granulosicoccus antarcticus]ASJ74185.1 5-hydroxyisourate hydrolase [Granulosicoccus antarcticus IMCC3135]